MTRTIDGYGWTPSLPDHRSKQFERTTPTLLGGLDLRDDLDVYDQKRFPTSSANAVASMYRSIVYRHLEIEIVPSRMFLYETTRMMNGNQMTCSIGDTLRSLSEFGMVNEVAWQYRSENFLRKLPKAVWSRGKDWHPFKAYSVQVTESDILSALIQNKNLVVGLSVYESMITSKAEKTGKVPLPSIKEEQIGGIAVEIVAYDLADYTFTIKTSWGDKWGKKGYMTIPIGYVTNPNLAGDMWTISSK